MEGKRKDSSEFFSLKNGRGWLVSLRTAIMSLTNIEVKWSRFTLTSEKLTTHTAKNWDLIYLKLSALNFRDNLNPINDFTRKEKCTLRSEIFIKITPKMLENIFIQRIFDSEPTSETVYAITPKCHNVSYWELKMSVWELYSYTKEHKVYRYSHTTLCWNKSHICFE